jgi:hypothetical protein
MLYFKDNDGKEIKWSEMKTSRKIASISVLIVIITVFISLVWFALHGLILMLTGEFIKGLSIFVVLFCLYKLSKHPKSPIKISSSSEEE